MSFDLPAALRRLKPQKKTAALTRRRDHELIFVKPPVTAGPPLLLDTTVYIDALQNRLPEDVETLLRVRELHHSSVAVAEMAHALGRLDPGHPETASACKSVEATIIAIPAHRLRAPSSAATIEAGILAGTMARLRDLPRTHKQALFNDAMLFLQALEQGSYLLSRNIGDLDHLQQLLPSGRMLLYRQKA